MKDDYFRGWLDGGLHEHFKRGETISSDEVSENLKYPKPWKPVNTDKHPVNTLILDCEEDYTVLKKKLDFYNRTYTWVSRCN